MNPTVHEGYRSAFFGGSFDPPHRGHLTVARAAQAALALDSVLFAPVGMQPLKPRGSTASFADRLEMTRLAIEAEPHFGISLADAPAPEGEHNYTIDTLLRLRRELLPGTELFCLMGADSFLNLKNWHRGAEIPFAAHLVVAARPGQQLEDLSEVLPAGLSLDGLTEVGNPGNVQMRTGTIRNGAGASAPFYLLPELHVDISASEIRAQVQAALDGGCRGNDLLPDSVCEYIAAHALYR
jgi:nicotinate-nucleotide adenylyltransferase